MVEIEGAYIFRQGANFTVFTVGADPVEAARAGVGPLVVAVVLLAGFFQTKLVKRLATHAAIYQLAVGLVARPTKITNRF